MPIGERIHYTGATQGFKVGDIIRTKHKPKNRSPYDIVQEVEDETHVIVYAMDDPSHGNRKARRKRYAERRRGK
jgi:3-deoxy-D-arabino-heptulosonate 7-phosphate (DAHP) synthase class II